MYDSDLNDEEWNRLKPFIEKPDRSGPKSDVDLRQVVNGIFYRQRTGCQWRMLPKDYGDWWVVSGYWYRWSRNDTWKRINTALREELRVASGKKPNPTVAILDSQSVKTAQKGGCAVMTEARR